MLDTKNVKQHETTRLPYVRVTFFVEKETKPKAT